MCFVVSVVKTIPKSRTPDLINEGTVLLKAAQRFTKHVVLNSSHTLYGSINTTSFGRTTSYRSLAPLNVPVLSGARKRK
jgi:hypothetical protein